MKKQNVATFGVPMIVVVLGVAFFCGNYGLGQSQREQNGAAIDKYNNLKKEMDETYRNALEKLPSVETKEALKTSQQAWQNYCDAEGRFEELWCGDAAGTAYYMHERMSKLMQIRLYHLRHSFGEGWPSYESPK